MNFCPECKTILKTAKKSLSTLQCPKCGYKTEVKPESSPTKNTNRPRSIREIAVVDKKESVLNTYPVVQSTCPECGGGKSETWNIAVGSEGTPASLTFFRCVSCGFTRREAE